MTAAGRVEKLSADGDGRATIRLESHATSGYRWELTGLADGLVVERHEVEPGQAFGAAARESFAVRLTGDRPVEVELVLKRPWESKPSEIRRVEISPVKGKESARRSD